MENTFDKQSFMAWLEETYDGYENPYLRKLVENLIDYGTEQKAHSRDGLIYFLHDILPDIEFGEIAAFAEDESLTNYGFGEKNRCLLKQKKG